MMTHIDPVLRDAGEPAQKYSRPAGAPGKDLLFLFRGLQGTVRWGPRNLTCNGRCASRVVNTPKVTGLRAGRLCATHFNSLGRP